MKCDVVLRSPCGGFTLVETLTVVALLAVIALMATPSFVAWHVRDQVDARGRRRSSRRSPMRAARLCGAARASPCADRCGASLPRRGQPCANGVTDWSCGWAVLAERGGALTLLRAQPPLAAVSITGVQTNLTFTPPAGQLIGSFRSFDVAPKTPTRATQGSNWRRCISIAAGDARGFPRVRVERRRDP